MKRILVVDDERRGRRVLQIMIEQIGFESAGAGSGEEALEVFRRERVDLVLTDLRMPGMSGLDLLERIREIDPEVPVILLTAFGTVQSAVEAMKRGAFDYILRPINVDSVESAIRRGLELRDYRSENRFLREQARASAADALASASTAMLEVNTLVTQVAPTKAAVLITGETGTGKEVVARAIHDRSDRRDKLFVPLNCAAIPSDLLESELFGHARGAFTGAQDDLKGKFEVADGGTLFLDEIGDMPYPLQAKLLRVLQEGIIEPLGSNKRIPIDVRLVSSTNRDLATAIEEDQFRRDLYYRLNVFHIQLAPLRERPEDVDDLAPLFLSESLREMGRAPVTITPTALRLLGTYEWPGNARELRNVMERAAVLCRGTEIDATFVRTLLPSLQPQPTPEDETDLTLEAAVEAAERKAILRALGATGDNKTQAGKLLGISERSLWYKLKKYGL